MKIKVKFLATIRVITGESSIELLCTHPGTAGTVMQMLVEKYEKKFKQVIMDGTSLKSSIKMIINGRDIEYLNGLDYSTQGRGCDCPDSPNCRWVMIIAVAIAVIGLTQRRDVPLCQFTLF